MRLALAEIRRAKLRFALLIGAVALLVFLILFQQSLAGSLLGQFTGGLERQSASVLVYNAEARRIVDASRVLPQQIRAVAAVEGVAEAGPIGEGSFTAQLETGELRDTSVFGYELGGPGAPTRLSAGRLPERDGEAVASSSDASAGYGIGQTVTVVPGDTPDDDRRAGRCRPVQRAAHAVRVVRDLRAARHRDQSRCHRGAPEPRRRRARSGVDPTTLATAITEQVQGVEALDRDTAVASLPGVSSIQQSFAIILGLAFVVVILLTGFFFLIITVQKMSSLTLLRAVGASSGFLVRNLIAQVLLVIGAALLVAVPLTIVSVNGAASAQFTATVEPTTVITTSAAVLLLGVLAALGAMRRVARIDPAAATTRLVGGGLA